MNIKQFFIPSIALAAIIIIACNKMQKAQATVFAPTIKSAPATNAAITGGAVISSPFNPNVGKLFPADTGAAWENAYVQMFPSSLGNGCVFNTADLQNILKYPGCIGISFSNAFANGEWLLIAQGVDTSASVIKTDNVVTSQGSLSFLKAESLKQSFIYTNPNGIYSEFFGTNVLNAFFQFAVMSQVVIKKGWNTKGERMILNNASALPTDAGGVVTEEGGTCPPYCKQ